VGGGDVTQPNEALEGPDHEGVTSTSTAGHRESSSREDGNGVQLVEPTGDCVQERPSPGAPGPASGKRWRRKCQRRRPGLRGRARGRSRPCRCRCEIVSVDIRASGRCWPGGARLRCAIRPAPRGGRSRAGEAAGRGEWRTAANVGTSGLRLAPPGRAAVPLTAEPGPHDAHTSEPGSVADYFRSGRYRAASTPGHSQSTRSPSEFHRSMSSA